MVIGGALWLEIENLSLSYGNSPKVLKNISLDVKKRRCVLFTGKSGSGKSSIYKFYQWVSCTI